jgi:hypothetical protein
MGVASSFLSPLSGGERFGVLAHPTVVDEEDRDGIQEVELLPPPPPRDDQAGFLEEPEMLHHTEPRHAEARLERTQRLPVLAEQGVEGRRRVGSASALNTLSTAGY